MHIIHSGKQFRSGNPPRRPKRMRNERKKNWIFIFKTPKHKWYELKNVTRPTTDRERETYAAVAMNGIVRQTKKPWKAALLLFPKYFTTISFFFSGNKTRIVMSLHSAFHFAFAKWILKDPFELNSGLASTLPALEITHSFSQTSSRHGVSSGIGLFEGTCAGNVVHFKRNLRSRKRSEIPYFLFHSVSSWSGAVVSLLCILFC